MLRLIISVDGYTGMCPFPHFHVASYLLGLGSLSQLFLLPQFGCNFQFQG